jgi:hypothetical protein
MMIWPKACTIMWWASHYAELRIMPMWGQELLVVALRVAGRSA